MQKTPIISEEDIRSYLYCSEFYHRGGDWTRPLLKWADPLLEQAFGNTMQTLILQPGKFLSIELLIGFATDEAIRSSAEFKTMPPEERKTHRLRIIQLVYEALELFGHKYYQVIAGPTNYLVKLGDQTVEIRYAGMFMNTNTRTLHTISFSHYPTHHSEANDLALALKLKFSTDELKNKYKIRHIAHHVFAFGHDKATNSVQLRHKLIHDPVVSDMALRHAQQVTNNMAMGVHYPTIPCPNSTCSFFKTCHPEYWK